MPILIVAPPSQQRGLSLVELMVSLAIGLLVVLGVSNIFLSNHAAFRSQEAMAQVQQNSRIAFELMAQDLRSAGGNPCGIPVNQVANALNDKAANWWSNWDGGKIRGYGGTASDAPVSAGTATNTRVANTDSFVIRSSVGACDGKPLIVTEHNGNSAQFKVNSASHCIVPGDILMACDLKQAAIFQVTNSNSNNATVVHNEGGGTSPGNSTKCLGLNSSQCASGSFYSFDTRAQLSRLYSVYWFVGTNDRGRRSLFRARSGVNGTVLIEEIAEGVHNMQAEYLLRTAGTIASDFVAAGSVNAADWNDVIAVRLTFTTRSSSNAGVNQQPIERTFINLISLRNQEVVP